jgi:cytochrome b6-f complex iron-sulfur subunit
MRGMPLRVVPTIGAGCNGCSRRVVLKGFAMTAASMLVGCPASEEPPPPDAPPPATTSMCGTNLCVDLADPLNGPLATVNGSLTVSTPKDTLVVVRTSATTLVALSNICTHQGCNVRYDGSASVLNCPCHGSRFSLAGSVLRGPAASPLKKYVTQFDQGMNLLTIML